MVALYRQTGKQKKKELNMENSLQVNNIQKNLVESALFISTKPLQMEELMRISGIGSLGYLKELIENLQKDYQERGIEITYTPEGWHMQVKKEYLSRVSHLTPHSDLSEGCKKTIALVIYKEPLKQSDLVKIQGTKAYVYVKELAKKGLLKAERSGHTKILKVTGEFESYFGETKEGIRKRILNSIEVSSDESKEKPEEKANLEKPKERKKSAKKQPEEQEAVTPASLPGLKELTVDDLIETDK